LISRLEKTLYRLEAQHACLKWAFDQIADRPGVIFEIGLGHGRTFSHMRHHLKDREIYAFDREKDKAYPDCRPEPEYMILGEVVETLPKAAERFKGQVVLGHSDIGSFDRTKNREKSEMISRALPPAIVPCGLVMSDLPLEMPGFEHLPLPEGAREDRYYIYRKVEA
jgi:hypothetical protein